MRFSENHVFQPTMYHRVNRRKQIMKKWVEFERIVLRGSYTYFMSKMELQNIMSKTLNLTVREEKKKGESFGRFSKKYYFAFCESISMKISSYAAQICLSYNTYRLSFRRFYVVYSCIATLTLFKIKLIATNTYICTQKIVEIYLSRYPDQYY